MTVRPSVGVLKLTFKGVLPQKPARILRPTRQWESNLDWTTDDVLQLTLGEEDVQWELKGSDVASMSIDDIKLPWKVHTLMKYFVVSQHAEARPTLDEDYRTTDVCIVGPAHMGVSGVCLNQSACHRSFLMSQHNKL